MGLQLLNKLFGKKEENISANIFLDIRDILDEFLYQIKKDNVIGYLKVYPKNCELMSPQEKIAHAKSLTKGFAAELKPFKIYLASRPIDLNKNYDYQIYLKEKERNTLKYSLLEKRAKSFGNLSTTGKASEGEIYIMLWEKNDEYAEQVLQKRLNEMKMKFTNSGYKTEILDEKYIIQIINSFNNSDSVYQENAEYLETPPIVIV